MPGRGVIEAPSLRALAARLLGEQEVDPGEDLSAPAFVALDSSSDARAYKDMSDVKGQPEAKRALEIAAAGGHHVALLGRAGVGKTLLAERLPGILPNLDDEQTLEVTANPKLKRGLDGTGGG